MRDCGVEAVHAIVPPERTESGAAGKRVSWCTVAGPAARKAFFFRQEMGGVLPGDGPAQEGGPFDIKV